MAENLRNAVHKDLVEAMKQKDDLRVGVLRMAIAAFEKKGTELRTAGKPEATEADLEAVLRSEVKRRKEAQALFIEGKRDDLAEKEGKEIAVLTAYLPPELSEADILAAVKAAIAETGAQSQRDFGAVMKAAGKALQGRADGKRVAEIAKGLLAA
jgi:uncharacterized protein YqeY